VAEPHITLLLAQFQQNDEAEVVDRVRSIRSLLPMNCSVDMEPQLSTSGTYSLWEVSNAACLQLLSDQVTAILTSVVVPTSQVPSWVEHLPEPERTQKIGLIHFYGSPNVFSGFQPHVTVAFDSQDNLTACADMTPPAMTFAVEEIAVGHVGDHGTVLLHEEIACISLTDTMCKT